MGVEQKQYRLSVTIPSFPLDNLVSNWWLFDFQHDLIACEQQKRRQDVHPRGLISAGFVRSQVCSCVCWFETYQAINPYDMFSRGETHLARNGTYG